MPRENKTVLKENWEDLQMAVTGSLKHFEVTAPLPPLNHPVLHNSAGERGDGKSNN